MTGIKRDSFIDISNRVFFQLANNKLLQFLAFFSKNINLTECSRKIYDKKLLANIKYFQ